MKKLILLSLTSVLMFSCAAMKKSKNLATIMDSQVFNFPAKTVYAAAQAEFKSMYVPLSTMGKFHGESTWLIKPVKLGKKEYQEKDHFVVKVTSKGKGKSIVRVTRDVQNNHMGPWQAKGSSRMQVYEYNILKRLDPSLAEKLDKKAETMK